MSLNERWCRYLEKEERFWKVCLKVARSKPHLCAEEVEAEAVNIMNGFKPEPDESPCQIIIQTRLDSYLRILVSKPSYIGCTLEENL